MSTAQAALGPLSFSEGVWTREPVSAVIGSDGALTVEAAEGSDWWRDTAYGFRHENGHALLRPRIGPMVCAPTRAGLMVRFTSWVVAAPDGTLHAHAEDAELSS